MGRIFGWTEEKSLPGRDRLSSLCGVCSGILVSADFIFQPHVVGDHGDEFGIGGFAPAVLDGVAEVGVEGVQIASVPGYLDGMADGPLPANTKFLENK